MPIKEMAKISARKLFLFGRYSLALLLPKKWLNELGIKAGQSVQLEFDRKRGRIVVRLGQNRTNPPALPAKKSPSKPDDWQPILEL